MQTNYASQIQTGTDVFGSDGEKIGDVAGVADSYFIIEKGWIFTTDIYVPMSAIVTADDDRIELNLTKDEIENGDYANQPMDDGSATSFDRDTETDTGWATRDAATESTGDVLERREERLTIDKQAEKTGDVRVGKHVVEQEQTVDVPVTREEVTFERRSVDRPAGDNSFSDEAIEVPVYEERVEASKDTRVVEELEVGKTAKTETARVHDTIRREEFDIDDDTDTTDTNR